MPQDWLSHTVEVYSEYESPKRFYYWSCLAAVSAILKDQVYFDRYLYQLYPNIFVLLFGPSAIKKGPPIALAKAIVSRVNNTRIINGRASVEAIIKELSVAQQGPGKPILKDSCGFIVSSELSSAIIGSSASLDILTDLADRIFNDEEWTHRTKGEGSIVIKNPTLTWISGTNDALFREFVPEKNIKGGLIGRTFVISESKGEVTNSLMFPPKIMPDRDKIADGVRHLANLKGPFKMDDKVRKSFDNWYIAFKEKMKELDDDTGTLGRTDDNILKIAMLVSCARRGDLEITLDDIKEGMTEVISLYSPTKKIMDGVKKAPADIHQKTGIVLRHLANMEGLSDTMVNILRKFTLQLNHEDLDNIVTLLERQKVLKVLRNGNEIIYSLDGENENVREYVDQYKR